MNASILPQRPRREPQGSQKLWLNESLLAFTTSPLRPLRRHGVLCGKKQALKLEYQYFTAKAEKGAATFTEVGVEKEPARFYHISFASFAPTWGALW